jgi:hypothetical protein
MYSWFLQAYELLTGHTLFYSKRGSFDEQHAFIVGQMVEVLGSAAFTPDFLARCTWAADFTGTDGPDFVHLFEHDSNGDICRSFIFYRSAHFAAQIPGRSFARIPTPQ